MGETQYRNGSYYASLSANRVTPEIKIRTPGLRQLERLLVRPRRRHRLRERDPRLRDLGPRGQEPGRALVGGGYVEAESSTYSNINLALTAAPAVEYDVFPYSESTKRQLRILYRIGFTRARYNEETIYFKTAESLLQESLSFAYEVVRPWGKAAVQLEGLAFLPQRQVQPARARGRAGVPHLARAELRDRRQLHPDPRPAGPSGRRGVLRGDPPPPEAAGHGLRLLVLGRASIFPSARPGATSSTPGSATAGGASRSACDRESDSSRGHWKSEDTEKSGI